MSELHTQQENIHFVPDPGVKPWVVALKRYLKLRSRYIKANDAETLVHWLQVQEQRKRIPTGRLERRQELDAFGLSHPRKAPAIDWQAAISSTAGQALGVTRIEAVGREALVLSLAFDLRPDQTYEITLKTSRKDHHRLQVLGLWQSRVLVNRWRVGAVILSIR